MARSSDEPKWSASSPITRLVGAILLERNDEWAVQRGRYMTLETIAPFGDDAAVSFPAIAS
jgi:putative transposase